MPKYVPNPFVSILSYTQLTTQGWRRGAAGSCSHAEKLMLPNDRSSTGRERMEKASVWGGQQEGQVCIIHPLLLPLFPMVMLCHVFSAQPDKRHITASSYLLGESTEDHDAPLSCPATGNATDTGGLIRETSSKRGCSDPGASPVLGDTPASARQGPEQPSLCCTCFERGKT